MKFLVFGAGVLGCNLANNLFRAGKDVTLLAVIIRSVFLISVIFQQMS